MRLNLAAVAAALLFASLAAHADSFTLTFGSSSTSLSGSGVLTTGSLLAPGEYTVASITGSARTELNGQLLDISSILEPGSFPTVVNGGTFPANDNVLFATNGIGSFDGSGLSFLLSGGAQINLYNPQGSANDAFFKPASGAGMFLDVPITIGSTAFTPEPSGLALLGTGLLGVVTLSRRFRRQVCGV